MKSLPPLLFALGYLLGGWCVIWTLVITFRQGDPKFPEAIGFYYGIWIFFYLPIAIAGVLSLAKLPGTFQHRMLAAGGSLFAVLAAMFVSFYLDAHWHVMLVEYFVFGTAFWLLQWRKT